MEPAYFKFLLIALVVAYKAWEYLRNSARKKSEAARNVPVPNDLEQMPWENEPDPVPAQTERPRPQILFPTEAPVAMTPIQPKMDPTLATPLLTDTFRPSIRTAPIQAAGNRAQPIPNLRDLVLGQVVLGKPASLSPRRSSLPIRP